MVLVYNTTCDRVRKSKTKYLIILLFVWQIDNTESALITDQGGYIGRTVNANIASLGMW